MADNTKIEWTEATWNPITGCSLASPGCTNCYAMELAGTRLANHESRKGLTQDSKAGPVWTGEVRFNEQWLDQPLRWKRPRMIFVCAHGDLFHESVPDEWIDKVFAVMILSHKHTFQVLTKRADRMRKYLSTHRWPEWAALGRALDPKRWRELPAIMGGDCTPVPNVWLGVSVEDQQRADERIPDLLATPAAVRWISAEPLLGPVDLTEWMICPNARDGLSMDPSTGAYECCRACDWTGLTFALDWVVVGGESGSKARPMHPDWARALRDQCATAGVPFFFKQWGLHLPAGQISGHGKQWLTEEAEPRWMKGTKAITGRYLDGALHDGMPGGSNG